ncbi:MAG: exodeoxyribonuclease III [Alphaproteobacteria bacterium]|nr:MAG: exodeoxyribonuclease III [Alphaproteobacteria bacterium]
MRLRLATWNINSVRLRIEQVQRFIAEQQPDVLCLQEIKCQEHEFPAQAFRDAGMPHIKISGQKGWHGVAMVSRHPIDDVAPIDACREGHARCVGGRVQGVEVHNFYVPAGGDVPDRTVNPKFDHKLNFYERLAKDVAVRDPKAPLIITGDLNVAPGEFDVWSHRQMSRIVSHTPIEIEAMNALRSAGQFTDIVREAVPDPQKLFSWWSYRANDFRKSNRGLRLDHIWITPGLTAASLRTGKAEARVHDDVREWERPSDHAPVSADFGL